MDQAAQQIANKLKPLMKAPYRLGFEIVKANDASTRMLGIFAFRISDDLVYAPCFFLSGDLKGTDLLYRCAPKTFVPANEDWANYLIEQDKDNTGRGISKDIRRQSPTNVDLRILSHPPSYLHSVKYASRKSESFAPAEGWDALLTEWSKEASLKPLLKDFIVDDGGMDAVTKIASAIDESYAFASALAYNVDPNAYTPQELIEKLTKSAAVKPEPKLVFYTGSIWDTLPAVPSDSHEKAASSLSSRGYYLMDKRASNEISAVTVDGAAHTMTGVLEPGVYNVVTQLDGTVKAFCATASDEELQSCEKGDKGHACYDVANSYNTRDHHHSPLIAVVELEGEKATNEGRHVFGEEVIDTEWGEPKADAKIPVNAWAKHMEDEMKPNKAYRIFDSNAGTLSKPVYVISKEEKNGITLYELLPYASSYVHSISVRHNKDYEEVRFRDGILGHQAKFLPVGGTAKEREGSTGAYDFEVKPIALGGDNALHDWIIGKGDQVKSASLHNVNETEFYFKFGTKQTEWMSKKAALLTLVFELATNEENANTIIKEAQDHGKVRFYIEAPITKRASVTRVIRDPNFITNYDHTFNVDVEHPQRFILPTETEQFPAPDQRVGDAHDPSMGQGPQRDVKGTKPDGIPTSILLKLPPDQIASFAEKEGLPHVFEHGVVGSLLSTYDSSSMIDKYLPKMEEALDAVGRTLFLFYWKPTDFQKLYGTDDMTSLENELLSNFKSWGDMVLNLTKKCQVKNNGSIAFSS